MKIVVTRLIGGLGNQMFQYAAGKTLALRHKGHLLIDTSGFQNYSLRRYELSSLNIHAEIASPQSLKIFSLPLPNSGRLGWKLNEFLSKIHLSKNGCIFNEKNFSYDIDFDTLKPPVYLAGYWQSERYFREYADEIRKDFTLKEPLDYACLSLLEEIRKSNAISLHVRRGDYVSNPTTAKVHSTCSLDYYRAAIDHIAVRIENPHFFVFSDDLEWVAENLRSDFPMTLVNVNGPDRGVADMALMKECQHHIIANSSFSWWGAWLNPSSRKIVIAPNRWFNDRQLDTRDLLPESWVRL